MVLVNKGLTGAIKLTMIFIVLLVSFYFIYNFVIPTNAEPLTSIWTADEYGALKTDFSPEQIVYIHGSNFLTNNNVDVSVTRPDGAIDSGNSYSDEIGNFIYNYQLDGITGTYYVTADDGINYAETTFTDANPAGDLDQCKNGGVNDTPLSPCQWVNGDLNDNQAHFIEGQSVPYRITLTNIPTSGTANCSASGIDCELLIGYDVKHSSKNALDYVTHFQRIVETVDPCLNRTPCVAGNLFDVPIPASILVNGTPQPNTSFNNLPAGERKIQIYNGQITGVSYVSQGNLLNADSESVIKIKFKASNSTVVIAWGGHIASLLDWGVGNSASGISGSPYHTRFKELCTPVWDKQTSTVILDCAGGNQDRSLKSAAVSPPPLCEGVDCSYLDNGCQVGVCNKSSGQCYSDHTDFPLSTPCFSSDVCKVNHCDGLGSCVLNYNVDCDDQDVCTNDYCDSVEGCKHEAIPNCCYTNEDCNDSNACTNDVCTNNQCQHPKVTCNDNVGCTNDVCDPSLGCVYTPDDGKCSPDTQCADYYCDAVLDCKVDYDPLSTPCEADSSKCTIDHCNGSGSCVFKENVPVPPAEKCKSFYCDPSDGKVKEDYTNFPLSTPCEADSSKCTIDHCNGSGSCVFWKDVIVPPAEQCKTFYCDPTTGGIKENYTAATEVLYESKPNSAYVDGSATNVSYKLCNASNYIDVDTSNGLDHYIYMKWSNINFSKYVGVAYFNLTLNHYEVTTDIKIQLKYPNGTWIDVCNPPESTSYVWSNCDLMPYINIIKSVPVIELRMVAKKIGACHEYLACAKIKAKFYECKPNEFCGDGTVKPPEKCELPNTNDNPFCTQTTTECLGKKLGQRDAYGNCDSLCGCIDDSFKYSCVLGECGAECDDNTDCQNKCVNDVLYNAGNCLDSCDCSWTTQNCNLQDGCYVYGNGCENRDYFCQIGGCNYTFSGRNTDYNDSFVNYCSADTVRKHRLFHDFYCNGACSDHTSWIDDQLVENCDAKDGWYNTSTTQWLPIGECADKEQLQQEYRDYTCKDAACDYKVTDNRWIDTGKMKYKELSTPCEADGDKCTIDHCNGSGQCVKKEDVDCSGLDNQCQEGVCNPSNGQCYPDYTKYPLSTPCEADSSKCTIDHCNGSGSCVFWKDVIVPGPQQCKSFYCDSSDGKVKENYTAYPLSTPCNADDKFCTIDHCNGEGSCVYWKDVDCSGYNLKEIAQCNWIPDNYLATFDYSQAFTSTCDEVNDECTEGSQPLTHTCADANASDGGPVIPVGNGVRTCDAECDGFGIECQNYCVNDIRYFNGNCDTNPTACKCSYQSENCDKDGCYVYGTGCEQRDYFCQIGGCNYTFSNRNTDYNDSFVNYCSDSTIRKHRTFHDFYCNGACSDHTSWIDDQLVENCDAKDGWYNTSTTQWLPVGECADKEQLQQEYRDYTCKDVSCQYTVTDNRWIDTGKIKNKELSTPCEADSSKCTIDHCNGSGQCVKKDNVDCSDLDDQCQEGVCNPSNGQCYPDYSKYPLSTPCEFDNNKCTIDHCDGDGSCETFDNVPVPPAEECKSFYCDPIDGQVNEDYTNFPLSTPCASGDVCKINHCDGFGECVFWKDVPIPSKPIKVIGDPKTKCNEGEWCEWRITTLTPITLTCEEGKIHWRYALDEEWKNWNDDGSSVTIYFPEESNHTLEAYCLNDCSESDHDIEKFKVEGTAFEIPLYKKWNLISVPFALTNDSISEVFKNISDKIAAVWTYGNGVWYVWIPGLGGTLTSINPGWGYWVAAKEDTMLLISGSLLSPIITPPSKDLQTGWNLIGYYGTEWQTYELEKSNACGYVNYNYGNYVYCSLNSLIDTQQGFPRWSSLWGYDNCGNDETYWHELESCLEGFWKDIKMYAGKGYWIEMDVKDSYAPATNCIWNEDMHCSSPTI